MTRIASLLFFAFVIILAACSQGSSEDQSAPEHAPDFGLFSALPEDLGVRLAASIEPHWTQCEDVWVTQFARRDGSPHPHAFIMAAALRLHHDRDLADIDTGQPVRIHVASGMHRVYQREDMPRRQPAQGPGWSEWIALAAPELPVWSVQKADEAWDVTFRPEAEDADHGRYARQYVAPDCSDIPEG